MTHPEHSLQPYPEYKDSGVEWLGEIPQHWRIQPGFSVFREKQQKNIGMIETIVLSLSYGRIVIKPAEKLHGLVPESFETYQIINPGDIIIRPTDLQNDWTSLRVGIARDRGIITSAYLCLQPNELVVADYGYLLLHAYDLMKIFYGMGSGLRQNLDFTDLKRMPVPIPPLDEQQAIVRFIDHIDHRVNRFIRAKRRLITLLNEQKQAIIHQAVTRGLDPHVRLKPSGIDGIEDIPEIYHRTKLGRICLSIRDGTHNPPPAVEGIHRLLSVRNIVYGQFITRADDRTMSAIAFEELQRSYSIKEGDIVLALVGGTTGKSAVVGRMENVTAQRSIGIIRPNKELINSDYLNFVIQSGIVQSQIRQIMGKYAAQPGIYLNDVSNLQVIFPDITIQYNVLFHLERILLPLEKSIIRTQREIDLIREYRTRLIADVVTGKLDVRGVVLSDDLPIDSPMLSADELTDDDDIDLAEEPANADD